MISRFTSPVATCASLCAIASICQFGLYSIPGRSKPNVYWTQAQKSVAGNARSSRSSEMSSISGCGLSLVDIRVILLILFASLNSALLFQIFLPLPLDPGSVTHYRDRRAVAIALDLVLLDGRLFRR